MWTEKVFHLVNFIAGMQLIVLNAHQRKAPFVIGNFMSDIFKTYIFKVESEKLRLEYSYYAHYYESDIQHNSDIVVRLIEKRNALIEYLPDTVRWEIVFKNKRIPFHPYYSFKFTELFDDFAFVAIEGELIKFDLLNSSVQWSKQITNTDIQFVSKFGKGIILLFDFQKFDLEKYSCNLKMVTNEGEILWTAKPIDHSHFKLYHNVRTSKGKIQSWSGSMYTTVDELTGDIEQPQFVK